MSEYRGRSSKECECTLGVCGHHDSKPCNRRAARSHGEPHDDKVLCRVCRENLRDRDRGRGKETK